ncbi:MAG TPA: hypothetical protein VFQ00_02235 [Terriglobales bacterium]|nr:hypothetical protein [Terriglobales bacterium]
MRTQRVGHPSVFEITPECAVAAETYSPSDLRKRYAGPVRTGQA